MSPVHPMCFVCCGVIGARMSSDLHWDGLPVYHPDQIKQSALDWCNIFRASKLRIVLPWCIGMLLASYAYVMAIMKG